LDHKNKHHSTWLKLHEKIKEEIKKIPQERRRYAEFIYFYILNEDLGKRDLFVSSYIDPNVKMISDIASRILDYELIKDHYEGKANPINIQRSEIYRRVIRPNDFLEAFPENINPQEIFLVGMNDFLQELKKVETD